VCLCVSVARFVVEFTWRSNSRASGDEAFRPGVHTPPLNDMHNHHAGLGARAQEGGGST
jgi:hypothetical protein